jgi:hypothetical protein
MTEEDSYTRAIAGLTLKNNILSEFNNLHLSVLAYIKDLVLSSLDKPDLDWDVRKAIDSVITAIVVRGQILNWPSAIDTLVNKLESPDPLAVEVCATTIL